MSGTPSGPSTMPNLGFLADLGLCRDPTANLLICAHPGCQHALSVKGSRVTTHLRDKHDIPEDARKGLTSFLKALPGPPLREPDEAPPRTDGSEEHILLRVYDGFSCRSCAFRTISIQSMRRHFSDSAGRQCPAYGTAQDRRAIEALFEYVFLQAWTTGPARKYWTIKRQGSSIRPAHAQGVQEHLRSVHEREQERDVDMVDCRDTEASGCHRPTFAEQRPWLERTGWDEVYRDGCHRHVLPSLIALPVCSRRDDRVLGLRGLCGLREDLVSPFEDEQKIGAILGLVDELMDRCEETARKTSRSILCWLRSTRALTPYSKPFTLVRQHTSTVKYRTLLKKCLAMVFRAYRMAPDVRQKATGIRLKKKHMSYMESIWNDAAVAILVQREESLRRDGPCRDAKEEELSDKRGATERELGQFAIPGSDADGEPDEADETDETDDDSDTDAADEGGDSDGDCGGDADMESHFNASRWSSSEEESSYEDETRPDEKQSDRVLELLLGLCLSLGTQPIVDGKPSSTVLVYFSGILGLKPQSQTYVPARSYTTHLSALVYNLRLLFLENALPLRSYPLLGISRRPRTNQLERLEPIRKQHMVMGSQSPFEELISLRDFGRVMARSDTPPFLLRWSDDGQSVSLDGEVDVTMAKFRRLCDHFIGEAESLCSELMFRWEPPVDLSPVKDDMTNDENGFSFVSHPRNNLQRAYLQLCERACSSHLGKLYREGGWNWGAIFRYFRREEAFRAALLGCLDATGGQKPRCSELLSLYCVNGEFGPRGVYVYNRAMVYVVRHHKAKRNTNREFIVARFLPAQVGNLLYKYLVYIRPFVDMLHREGREGLWTGGTGSPLLFRLEAALGSKPWPTGRLTTVLKRATSKVFGVPINSRQFRQLCIGITEKHVREIYEPFNRFDDTSDKASRNVVFAWQSGHRPLQRGTTYGLDGAFPNKLQPQLLELYQWASSKWHEFLHLPSYVTQKPLESRLNESGSKMACLEHDISTQNTGVATKRRRGETLPKLPTEGERGLTKRFRPGPVGRACKDSGHRHDGILASGPGSAGSPEPASTAQALFGRLGDPATASELHERRLILEHLDDCNDNTEDTLKTRLTVSRLGEQIRKWRTAGCQLCFANDDCPDHDLSDCTKPGSERARDLLEWLHTLQLDRFAVGLCSLCHATNDICREVRINLQISDASTDEVKNHWRAIRDAVNRPDGLCGNKESVRMTIAALCAWDGRILGKVLARVASDRDGIDLDSEHEARQWLERQNNLGPRWIPQILVVFGILVSAFDFLKSQRVRRHSDSHEGGSESDPASENSINDTEIHWGTKEETTDWAKAVEWWKGKCAHCVGRGWTGHQVSHNLRNCESGGKQHLRKELGEAIFQEGFRALGGCSDCAMPREFCNAWMRLPGGRWQKRHDTKCQYGRLVYDTIIGLFYSKNFKFRNQLIESMMDEGIEDLDDEGVAAWLGTAISVEGTEGSEILRQLKAWTDMVRES